MGFFWGIENQSCEGLTITKHEKNYAIEPKFFCNIDVFVLENVIVNYVNNSC